MSPPLPYWSGSRKISTAPLSPAPGIRPRAFRVLIDQQQRMRRSAISWHVRCTAIPCVQPTSGATGVGTSTALRARPSQTNELCAASRNITAARSAESFAKTIPGCFVAHRRPHRAAALSSEKRRRISLRRSFCAGSAAVPVSAMVAKEVKRQACCGVATVRVTSFPSPPV